jgi:hypothetical protein
METRKVIESITKEEGGKEGKACKLFIGWNSVADHMNFKETEVFKENVGLLKKGHEGVEMVNSLPHRTRDLRELIKK